MAAQPLAKNYTQEELQETVEFNITFGNEHKTFKVLRLLLNAYAPSLASLFRYPGIKSVMLTDVPVKSFHAFLGWLRFEYTNSRYKPSCPWNIDIDQVPDFSVMDKAAWDHYDCEDPIMWNEDDAFLIEHAGAALDMYVFAGRYEIPRLRLDAIDRLVWCLNRFVDVSSLEWRAFGYIDTATLARAWENLSLYEPVRELLCEGFCLLGNHDDETMMALPKEFLVSVLRKALVTNLDEMGGWDPCDYHEHANQSERDACEVRVKMQRGM